MMRLCGGLGEASLPAGEDARAPDFSLLSFFSLLPLRYSLIPALLTVQRVCVLASRLL